MTGTPRLSVVSDEPERPCYACGSQPAARCAAAWHVYGYDLGSTRCPVRSGEYALTAGAAQRITAAVQAGNRGTPPAPGDPPLWGVRVPAR